TVTGESVFQELLGTGQIATPHEQVHTEILGGPGDQDRIVEASDKLQALGRAAGGGGVVGLGDQDPGVRRQRLGPCPGGGGVGGQRAGQPVPALAEPATGGPVAAQRGGDTQPDLRLTGGGQAPAHRGAQVVQIGAYGGAQARLVRPEPGGVEL